MGKNSAHHRHDRQDPFIVNNSKPGHTTRSLVMRQLHHFINQEILNLLTLASVLSICFGIYLHYWYREWIGGYGVMYLQVLAIGWLFFFALVTTLYKQAYIYQKITITTKHISLLGLLYLLCGLISVFWHEENFDHIKENCFYLFTPIMVYGSVLALYGRNSKVIKTLKIIFLLGVVFALYSFVLRVLLSMGIVSEYYSMIYTLTVPYMNDMSEAIPYLARFTIPGLGPNVLQSMLVPIILSGFYFHRTSHGRVKYLYLVSSLCLVFLVVMTSSRGAFVSLAVGSIYLARKGWLRVNKRFFVIAFGISCIFIVYGTSLISRLYQAHSVIIPSIMEVARGGDENNFSGETRFVSMADSMINYFAQKPFLGAGYTFFRESQEQRLRGTTDHNFYTSMLAQGGVFIFTPLMLLLFSFHVTSRNVLAKGIYREPASRDLGILLRAGFLAYLVDLNFPPGFFHYYWVWFGFLTAWARNSEVDHCSMEESAREMDK